MAVYFADSSALSKRYVAEVGSAWLRAQLDPATNCIVYVAHITAVELIAAITRRERGGTLTAAEATTARAQIRMDIAMEYQLIEVTDVLIERAMSLAEAHGLRGYDAVQLAAALDVNDSFQAAELPTITLLSADAELNATAMAEGLTIENPNDYP